MEAMSFYTALANLELYVEQASSNMHIAPPAFVFCVLRLVIYQPKL